MLVHHSGRKPRPDVPDHYAIDDPDVLARFFGVGLD